MGFVVSMRQGLLATIESQRMHEVLVILWSLFLALFVGFFVTFHPID